MLHTKVRLCADVKSSAHLKAICSTSGHRTILALHAIRKFTAVFTKSGKGTRLSPTQSTLPHYVPSLRCSVIFSLDRAAGLQNSLTHSEQNSVCVSYSHHARYVYRQSHPTSKTKARCTEKLNTAPVIPNTVRRSQEAHRSCRSLLETNYDVLPFTAVTATFAGDFYRSAHSSFSNICNLLLHINLKKFACRSRRVLRMRMEESTSLTRRLPR